VSGVLVSVPVVRFCASITEGVGETCSVDVVAGVAACPDISFNSAINLSNCAKYILRLFISFPFAISSKSVVAFLEMYSAFITTLLLFIVFPCARKSFPCVT